MSDRSCAGIAIRPAELGDMDTVRDLFREYADWLQVDLCFQGFEAELAGLPGGYGPPSGGLWLAKEGDQLAGIIGFRPLDPGRCEMKRLWVRPAFRGQGLGERLVREVLGAARAAGYEKICLDTLSFMAAARKLYADLGFYEIPAYYHNPEADVRYMEMNLRKL
ncbi:MAG: GNAT family N-acetyltransferase [Pseudomonadota bacterium]